MVAALPDFDPSLVAGYFGTLISCIKVVDDAVIITQGSERLATLSTVCLLYIFSHLSAMGLPPGVPGDICQQYVRIFPPNTEFNGLPFCHTFGAIHFTLHQGWKRQHWRVCQAGHQQVQWIDYKLSNWEGIAFIHALTKLAQSEYQRRKKVPCWIVRFVLHTLSLNPLPSTSIIVDCLSIIAICLD